MLLELSGLALVFSLLVGARLTLVVFKSRFTNVSPVLLIKFNQVSYAQVPAF